MATDATSPHDERLRRGDAQALAEVLEANRARIERTIRLRLDPRLGHRVTVDDVMQDAWLAALARLPHYARDVRSRPYTWLRLIVVQTIIDLHRHHLGVQQRDPRREVAVVGGGAAGGGDGDDGAAVSSAALAVQVSAAVISPSGAAIRGEAAPRVTAALAALSATDRDIIALRHFEDLANDEVAEALGLTSKNASIRYIRAITRLKAELERQGLSLGDLHGR